MIDALRAARNEVSELRNRKANEFVGLNLSDAEKVAKSRWEERLGIRVSDGIWRASKTYKKWLKEVESRYNSDDPSRTFYNEQGNKGSNKAEDEKNKDIGDQFKNNPNAVISSDKVKEAEKLGNDPQTLSETLKTGRNQIEHNKPAPPNVNPVPTDFSLTAQMKMPGQSSLKTHPLFQMTGSFPNLHSSSSTSIKNTGSNLITYVVKTGDSLSQIAQQFFGDSKKWEQIYNDNKSSHWSEPKYDYTWSGLNN